MSSKLKKFIYFDNSATTKIAPEVFKEMLPYLKENFANPSSKYEFGRVSKNAIEKSRKIIANYIGANPEEIIFTSGGTESNNFAIKGVWAKAQESKSDKTHIITTKIEHDSVLNVCRWLETRGAQVTYLDVDSQGFIDLKKLEQAITPKTLLVSIIHANNEIGTIQNLGEIGKICRAKKVLFHTDACQSLTKVPIDVNLLGLDLVTLNAHKIHGPKGVGALYIRKQTPITALFHGGGHERRLRSGTENVSGIVGFGKAIEISDLKQNVSIRAIAKKLVDAVTKIKDVKLNGAPIGENRLCNNINLTFSNIEGESIGMLLEQKKILTSTGSACMSNTLEPSHVLRAIGLTHLESNSSIRITLSRYTVESEIDKFLEVIPSIVTKLRAMSPVVRN